MSSLIYKTTLKKRGWTESQISSLIIPKKTVRNKHYSTAGKSELFSLSEVQEIESREGFIQNQLVTKARAEKSLRSKIDKLIGEVQQIPILIPELEKEEMDEREEYYYFDYLDESAEHENKILDEELSDSPFSKKDDYLATVRLVVNYLERILYREKKLYKLTKGKVGRFQAEEILYARFINAVKETYPSLIARFEKELSAILPLIERAQNPDNPNEKVASDKKSFANYKYTKEFTGSYQVVNSKKVLVIRRHGKIVNALMALLTESGYKVGNTKEIDLFTYCEDGGMQDIIEVKTNSKSPKQIQQGIGQLISYGAQKKYEGEVNGGELRLILVLPKNNCNIPYASLLSNDHGIRILYYTWVGDRIIFLNLESLFPNLHS